MFTSASPTNSGLVQSLAGLILVEIISHGRATLNAMSQNRTPAFLRNVDATLIVFAATITSPVGGFGHVSPTSIASRSIPAAQPTAGVGAPPRLSISPS